MTGQAALAIRDDAVEPNCCMELARRGKEAAARFLERRGYEIVERDWTCSHGSIDIIALDANESIGECALVFVGVKTSHGNGFPEGIMDRNREHYEMLAISYLRASDCVDMCVRFDAIAINVILPDRAFIRHHLDVLGFDAD